MFQDIFSEVILPRENTQPQICTNSIDSPSLSVPIPKVCLYCRHYLFSKKQMKKQKKCMFFPVFYPLFQEEDSFEQLNLIVPGSLLCFKQEIGKIFEKEKFLQNKEKVLNFFLEILKSNLFS